MKLHPIVKTIKSLFINIFIMVVSFFVMFLLAEGVLRLFFNKVDYLKPTLVFDAKLGDKILPYSSGHDSLGYRNEYVPDDIDWLAIGDSQTYGVNATAYNSWPKQLQDISNKEVYNMGLGGFGPLQYYHTLTEEGLKLNPEIVIVGYYLGNDILETFIDVYVELPYWQHLKNPNFITSISANPRNDPIDLLSTKKNKKRPLDYSNLLQRIRIYLGSNSVLYRMIGSQMSKMVYQYESNTILSDNPNVSLLNFGIDSTKISFEPLFRLQAVDLKIPEVVEGMRINHELFKKINEITLQQDITLLVVLIPTKENVFSKKVEEDLQMKNRDAMLKLISAENLVLQKTTDFFEEHDINYISVLPEMQESIDSLLIYPSNLDGHPNQFGYEIIAEEIHNWISKNHNELDD